MFFEKSGDAPQSIYSLEDYPSIRIVRLRGRIDQTTVAELERFRQWVGRHRGFKHKNVLLDFRNVTQVDTAAVAEILRAVSELKTAHFRLGAIHLNETVRGMFQVLKAEKWVEFYNNESDAMEEFKLKGA